MPCWSQLNIARTCGHRAGKVVVHSCNCSVSPREAIATMGPSGAGQSLRLKVSLTG